MPPRLPRSLRNHNPLSIKRTATTWGGEAYLQPGDKDYDPTFEQFTSDHYGLRAGARLLANYQRVKGFQTIREILAGKGQPGDKDYLAGWAPSHENNTEAYIETVSKHLGVRADEPISLVEDTNKFVKLIGMMVRVECGYCPFLEGEIFSAIKAAGVLPD